LDRLFTNIRRAETPLYQWLKRLAKGVLYPKVRQLPGFTKGPLRFLYEAHFGVIVFANLLCNTFYRHPLFQARCVSVGKNVSVDRLPFITGPVEIHIGNNVWIGGNVVISAGRVTECPRLILKDYAEVSWNVSIAVNKEVIIGEHARVSYDCRISDSDGHPREADLRAANEPMRERDIRPVHIGRHAWIGNGSHIMKGVTIGEGAVIGANSVVINDIPPYCLALGNPAEVFLRNFGKPKSPFPPEQA
jgi:acetyltransferase-like isoleucine patch superfamily enzyme